MLNTMKWDTVRLAQETLQIHFLITNEVNGQSRIVNSNNTVFDPKLWKIDFIGFKYSDTTVLQKRGLLFPR